MTKPISEFILQPDTLSQQLTTSKPGALENKQDSNAPDIKKITLKNGDAFLITDTSGDLSASRQEMGLFWHGTRFLRTCNLLLNNRPLPMLSHHIADRGNACQIDLTNAPIPSSQNNGIEQGAIHVCRHLDLQHEQLVQTITVTSFHAHPATMTLSLNIDADFRDLFEVRGHVREARGTLRTPAPGNATLLLGYHGLDAVQRETQIMFTPLTEHVTDNTISWQLHLTRGQPVEIRVVVAMSSTDEKLLVPEAIAPKRLAEPTIHTNNLLFNRLLTRGMHDLQMLSTLTPHGHYPYAGVPWFSAPFGRDGLITCLEFLPWFPDVARGTLAFLAEYQGRKIEPFTDEQPGKILHEFRKGELANRREIPYIPYYGSIDATPLFIVTLEQYIRWTNDLAFLERLWPNAQAAARWMLEYGDKDGDTFLEYQTDSAQGLSNQGWKDAWDSVSYSDGRGAHSPIALSEVQGYAYAAYRAMSYLADRLGKPEQVALWEQTAEELRVNFLQQFWWEGEGVFYLALDGSKRPCDVVTTNPGQCLWTGIVPEDKAQRIIQRLMQEDMYSGWGLRTLSTQAARYNPMSYHNGSVWPHDTAIVGAGFARYGGKAEAGQLLHSMLETSLHYDGGRLPELHCGFPRRADYGPTRYPVACSPQAWSAGAPFMLLNALLGLQPDAQEQRLLLHNPTLPPWLQSLEIHGMHIGPHHVHLHLERHGAETRVMLGEKNEAEVVVV